MPRLIDLFESALTSPKIDLLDTCPARRAVTTHTRSPERVWEAPPIVQREILKLSKAQERVFGPHAIVQCLPIGQRVCDSKLQEHLDTCLSLKLSRKLRPGPECNSVGER